MAEYERQHYLPQFHLRNFASNEDSGCVWSYSDKKPVWKRRSIKKEVGWEPFFYSVPNDDGTLNHEIEHAIDRDDSIPPAIQRLLVDTDVPFTTEDKQAVARFVGLLMVRVPQFHNWASDVGWNHARAIANHLHSLFLAKPETLEHYNQLYREMTNQPNHPGFSLGNTDPARMPEFPKREQTIQAALSSAVMRADHILKMGWTLFLAPESSDYITSDNPVFTMHSQGRSSYAGGLGERDIELTVPLSRKVLLLTKPQGAGQPLMRIIATDEQVGAFNLKTAHYATRLIASPVKEFPGKDRVMERFAKNVERSTRTNE